jgi:class 3 adenylate cyclase
MPIVQVRLLGPLEVGVNGRRLELRRKQQRALLALMALHAGELMSTDRLVDELWGESPPKAVLSSLQNLVSELRKQLGPELLITQAPGYLLDLERDQVDVHRFGRLVEDSRKTPDRERTATRLREAISLWRGRPLADLAFEPFALLVAPRLEELRLLAYEDLIDAELELGRHADLLGEIEALVEQHPFDERLRAQLVLALYRSGRQAAALDAYRKARRFLIEELGLEPSARLRELEQAILRQDSSLAPHAPSPATFPVRKTVTVLFADLVDSTALAAQLDPEALRQFYDRTFESMRGAIERHGGTVEKFIGDAVVAVFGVPAAHEDDARRALRAAVELRERLAALSTELERERGLDLRVRVGVNTGEVFVGDSTALGVIATGAAFGVAKRLEDAAPPGEILLGPATHRLVRDSVGVEALEPIRLKDGTALGTWRLVGVVEGAPAIARRLEVPLIGRGEQLAQLRSAFEQARDERRSKLVAVVGEPGIGKTRVMREFVGTLGSAATVVVGECAPYGEGVTWLPLAHVVRQLGDPSDVLADGKQAELVARRVEELIGADNGHASVEEGFSAVRELFEAGARSRPLVVVFEDAHWAESTLLDLIEYLADRASGAAILLLALTRPELVERRPSFERRAITLERLAKAQARALIDSFELDLTREVRSRVVEVARGNPLFVEQLLAHAHEEGALLDGLDSMPPSVEALLASRLDLLAPEERTVLQRASVVGSEFSRETLQDLAAGEATTSLDAHLRSLERKGFIHGTGSGQRLGFHHVLVRDVAYSALPKAERAELHERLADTLERRNGSRAGAPDEIVGYHLEQASRYRRELMPRDEHGLLLGRRAARLLAGAGRRARARADWPGAAALLSRAVAVLVEGDPERVRLLPDLARAVGLCGDYRRELALLDEAVERAEAAGDRRTRSYAVLYREHARTHVDPAFSVAASEAEAREAIGVFEEIGDADGLARAWARLAHCRWFSGHHVEARLAAERTLAHALSVGDEALEADSRGLIGNTLLNGPDPLDDLLAYAEQLTEPGHRRLWTLLARAHAMRGDFTTARRLIGQHVAAFEEVGSVFAAVVAAGEGFAMVEQLAGDLAASERYLTESFQALTEAGDTGELSSVAARLASVVAAQGRNKEAERLTYVSEEAASPDDYLSQILWRSTRGGALAGQGRAVEGERFARAAVAIAEATDDINLRADALVVLAGVLRIAHRLDEVAPAIEDALRLYDEKGNVVSAGRARALQGGPQATQP